MASTSSDDKKIIFAGQYYEAWKAHIVSYFISKEELCDLLDDPPSITELEYLELHPVNYEESHKTHRRKQESGKSFIFARVTLPILNTIRRCKTVREVLFKLDQEYKPQSAAAELMARKRFYGMRFNDGGDMEQYLRIFHENADLLRDTGHHVTPREEISQLMASLSANYDIAVTNYNLYALQHGHSLEMLKRMIRDRYERSIEDKKLLPKYAPHLKNTVEGEKPSTSRRSEGANTNQRYNRSSEKSSDAGTSATNAASTDSEPAKVMKCFQCSGIGHTKAECPSKSLKETKSSTYEEKKQNAHAMVIHAPAPTLPKNETSVNFFLLDSGAYRHMSAKKDLMTNVTKLPVPQQLTCAQRNVPLFGTHKGDILIDVTNRFGDSTTLFLQDVLYVPDLEIDLLSEDQITKTERYEIRFTHQFADVFDVVQQLVIFSAVRQDNAKYVYYEPIQDDRQLITNQNVNQAMPVRQEMTDQPTMASADETPITDPKNAVAWTWHRRLGHVPGKYLQKLISSAEGMPTNLKIPDDCFRNCEVCLKAKSTELGHNTVRRSAERKFDIVAADIMGPYVPTKTGEKFVLVFLDMFTHYVSVDFLKKKSDAAASFARYHKRVESQFPGTPLRMLRTDCAKEFHEGDCKAYCEAAGIEIEDSCPYAPQLNGAVERMNRTLKERMRALLFDAGLGWEFWSDSMRTAAYLINRSPTRTNTDFKTPFELWHNRKPNLTNLRIFGSLAYRHVPEDVRNRQVTSQRRQGNIFDGKLCPRAEKRLLLGYNATGYVVYDPLTKKSVNSCDVRVDENRNLTSFDQPDYPPVVPDSVPIIIQEETPLLVPVPETTAEITVMTTTPPSMPDDEMIVNAEIIVEQPRIADHTYARALLCSQSRRHPKKLLEECVPTSYAAISGNPYESEWREAVKLELDALKANNVFSIIKKTTGMKTIDTKWVFDIKFSPTGEPRAKARLVARGFRDTQEYLLSETYSPVVNNWLIRWAFSLANRRNLDLVQYDVSTAFLHADIPKKVYLSVPAGMHVAGTAQALQLERSLYGLKSSSKNWYNLLDEKIREIGFLKSKADRCLYYRHLPDKKIAILLVYVDDLLLLTDSPLAIEETTACLAANFKLKIEPNPSCFVGYEIERDRDKKIIKLSQKRYTQRILERFSLAESFPQSTPMETGLKISKPANGTDNTEYRAMIGALSFLARNTRPDIAFAVNTLSRIQNCSTEVEKTYVRRIFRYLQGTQNAALKFTSTGSKLEAYVDASYAPDISETVTTTDLNLGRSVSGYFVRLFGDPIIWGVKKQSIVASSSTAAELIAVHDALDDIRMARYVMQELFSVTDPVTVFEDNSSTTNILMGGQQKKARSVLIKCYDALEAVQLGEITLTSVSSANQLADLLTKALDKEKFQSFFDRIFDQSA